VYPPVLKLLPIKTITIKQILNGTTTSLKVESKIETPYSLTIKVKEQFLQEANYKITLENIETPVGADNKLLS